MISIYSQDNTEYTKNGDAVLIPTKCDLALTINGAWQLTLEHPYDPEERYKYIIEGAVIQCDIKCIRELPTVKQRFRIYTYTKGLHGITAIGFPIAMESTYDAPIDNLVISGKTGAQAMALIQAFTNKYTLSTDVTKTASASMSNTNVNSAIASGNANSFIGAWGGEILYSNYDFMVKNRLGDNVAGDHRIIYGRNLTDIEYKKDDSGLTTRIYPISEDGIRLNGTGYVDSPKISDYPIIHHRFMSAPYNLIDTDASSASATAQQTRTSLAAISAAATTLSQGVDISSYPPEYIKQQRADIVAAVQTMALNGVISTSLYNAAAKTI
jgi:phage minor structural protein